MVATVGNTFNLRGHAIYHHLEPPSYRPLLGRPTRCTSGSGGGWGKATQLRGCSVFCRFDGKSLIPVQMGEVKSSELQNTKMYRSSPPFPYSQSIIPDVGRGNRERAAEVIYILLTNVFILKMLEHVGRGLSTSLR